MKKTLITLGLVGATLLTGGGLMELNAQKEIGTLPVEQVLKVDVANILGSSEKDGVVEYKYVSTQLKPAEKLNILDEDMSRRTKNSQTWKMGTDVNDKPLFHTKIYSNDTFYQKGKDWYQIDYATTTKASYDLQVGTPVALVKRAWATDFLESASQRIWGTGGVYSTVRTTASAYGDFLYVGQDNAYTIWRDYLRFDTSAIGGGTVTGVTMTLTFDSDSSTTDFNVVIKKYDWSASYPMNGTRIETDYDGCLAATADDNIFRSTSGASLNTPYTSGALATAYVNNTGVTYYCLQSSRDIGSNTPTGNEYVRFASYNNGTPSYRPYLNVTYTAGSTAVPIKEEIIIFE